MLNIFYGRECIDKAKFIFENIGETGLVIVPEQFTLAAESLALQKLEAEGLMDIEVMSLTRLASRIFSEKGGQSRNFINEYGRHVLLSKIMAQKSGELEMYASMWESPAFVQKISDFISQAKLFGVTSEDIAGAAEEIDEKGLLRKKLLDISKIYAEYEKSVVGKYIDNEDYLSLLLPKIADSRLVAGKNIWIWGFDWFSPKHLDVIKEMALCGNVNMVITYSEGQKDDYIFQAGKDLLGALQCMAQKAGIKIKCSRIDEAYKYEIGCGDEQKNPVMAAIEGNLFCIPPDKVPEDICEQAAQGRIVIVNASNYYSEAVVAAAYIKSLIRDKNLRLKDIAVICNDQGGRGEIAARIFKQAGIEVFLDQKRGILHHSAAAFVLTLAGIMSKGYNTEDVIKLAKTGLLDISREETEELENYAIKYKIRGTGWKKPFAKGAAEYGDEKLAEIEALREKVISSVQRLEEKYKKSRRASDRTEALYKYIKDDICLPDKLNSAIDELLETGLHETAEEVSQLWGKIAAVLTQIVEVLGEESISLTLYEKLLQAGLSAVKVGLLPPTVDGLVMGTTQRSRLDNIRALVIIGANDGVLPISTSDDGLLSEADKKIVLTHGKEVGRLRDMQAKEERLAIYRCLAAPSEYLFISCALSDSEGKRQKPSEIWKYVKEQFLLQPMGDISDSEEMIDEIFAPDIAMEFMAGEFNLAREGNPVDDVWIETFSWCMEHSVGKAEAICTGLLSSNHVEDLSKEQIEKLYRGPELTISPSAIEKYSRCPFAHFVSYGLKPEERRIFEMAGREIGDLYHECIMEFSKTLTESGEKGLQVCDGKSLWQTITQEESDKLVCKILEDKRNAYKEGLAKNGDEENYRSHRIERILCRNAWALISHVRAGKIEKMIFEVPFGKGKSLPPIVISAGDKEIRIEGKIDRVDYLPGETVKIIDYKSGEETIKPEDAESGWKLQLMLYLRAAKEEKFGPAGVFYYNIVDSETNLDAVDKEKFAEKLEAWLKEYKLKGLLVDRGENVENIAGTFSDYSDVVSGLRNVKDKEKFNGYVVKGDNLLTEEEFKEFSDKFDGEVTKLCKEFAAGIISIKPKKKDKISACVFCNYKGICGFDNAVPGYTYKNI